MLPTRGPSLLLSHTARTPTQVKAGCVEMFVGCLTSQQHASVSQGRMCSDICTCFHTEVEVAGQACYLVQLQ